jgi:two-component system, NarL family, response regulator NreC
MTIRTLIADDHAIFRCGLRALLEKDADIEVVAEAGNGFETIRAAAAHPIDVLILDLCMPGLQGARVAETVVKEQPHVAIVVLTMHEDSYYWRELFRIGVRGFVLKKSSGTNLLHAIRAAYRGEHYVDPSLTGRMISDCVGLPVKDCEGRLDVLTPREREVCTFLGYGYTNAEIAEMLSISERTVETHRANIFGKLELKTRAEMVRFALENGLIRVA